MKYYDHKDRNKVKPVNPRKGYKSDTIDMDGGGVVIDHEDEFAPDDYEIRKAKKWRFK